MPIGPWIAVALGTALGLWSARSRKRREREREVLAELAMRHSLGAPSLEGELVALHRGLPVTLGFGVPEGKRWERGLFARARYAIGAGPRFVAAPRDVSAHTRTLGRGYPIAARFERGYDVLGEHREGRALAMSVLAREETDVLPAPYFLATGTEVQVHLPELVPDPRDPSVATLVSQLVALTGELALFGQELLRRDAEQLGGALVIDRTRSPVLSARWATGRGRGVGELDGELVLSWEPREIGGVVAGARSFSLTVRVPHASPRELDVAGAIASLEPEARQLAARTLARVRISAEPGWVVAKVEEMLDPDELAVLQAMLVQLSDGPARGPFR